MAEDLLQKVFCPAVQALLSAGRSEGGKCCTISERRPSDAVGCLREDLDGTAGGIRMIEGSASLFWNSVTELRQMIFLQIAVT